MRISDAVLCRVCKSELKQLRLKRRGIGLPAGATPISWPNQGAVRAVHCPAFVLQTKIERQGAAAVRDREIKSYFLIFLNFHEFFTKKKILPNFQICLLK